MWQMWCDSSCDWQGLSEIALQKLVEVCLGLRSEEQGRAEAGKNP